MIADPGYEIVRNVRVMGEDAEPTYNGEVTMGHAEVRIKDLVVPDAELRLYGSEIHKVVAIFHR